MKRGGGVVKNEHKNVCVSYGANGEQRKNPIFILAAVARHALYHSPLSKFSVVPKRRKWDYAYEALRRYSKHVPIPPSSNTKRNNLTSTFLYSFCFQQIGNSSVEVSLHGVLGKEGVSFTWCEPSYGQTLSSLSTVLRRSYDGLSGGHAEVQRAFATTTSIFSETDLSDVSFSQRK